MDDPESMVSAKSVDSVKCVDQAYRSEPNYVYSCKSVVCS